MFDLDYYLNLALEIKICNKIVHVKQPSISIRRQMQEIEKDITQDNIIEKRLQVMQILVNNNREGIKFTDEQLAEYPLQAANLIIEKLNNMIAEAESDPN